MTVQQMHNEFKVLLDKADGGGAPSFLPTEIDLFLNSAVEKFISKRAFGNNFRRTSFEEDQKRRDDLRNLIQSSANSTISPGIKPNSYSIRLPGDYRHAISEECILEGSNKRVSIKPLSYDRYNKIINDPFNSPSHGTVYRMDFKGNTFQLISETRVITYFLLYISNPQKISLTGSQDDVDYPSLANHTHKEIIRMAVLEALENVEQPRYQTSKIELNEIE
jgi:hypothetical protein